MKYDVYGLGNALMDIQAFVDDALLERLKIKKGVMHLIDQELSEKILSELASYNSASIPGGSCANTLSTMALLGSRPVYMGIVADDMYGRLYETKMVERGVKSLIRLVGKGLTGSSIVLTTEDAERTMNTHLGVCQQYTEEDVNLEILKDSLVFHCTGYQWDTESQKRVVEYAMKNARKNNLKISFDIADPFCIERNVDDFKKIINDHVDILFGNRDEVKILTGCEDPVAAGKAIREMGAEIALVKVGGEGSYLFYDDKVEKIGIYKPEKVLDSTGCGDIYGAGFLYGYTKGYTNIQSANIASYLAAQIIQVPGVKLEELDFVKLKSFIEKEIIG